MMTIILMIRVRDYSTPKSHSEQLTPTQDSIARKIGTPSLRVSRISSDIEWYCGPVVPDDDDDISAAAFMLPSIISIGPSVIDAETNGVDSVASASDNDESTPLFVRSMFLL